MAEHVRKAAVQRVSSNSSRQTGISQKTEATSDSIEVPSRFGKPIKLPYFVKTNPHLKNKELTMGQKQYLWGIARIYSMSHMKTQVNNSNVNIKNNNSNPINAINFIPGSATIPGVVGLRVSEENAKTGNF